MLLNYITDERFVCIKKGWRAGCGGGVEGGAGRLYLRHSDDLVNKIKQIT